MSKSIITILKIFLSLVLLWFLVHTSSLDFHILTYLFETPLLLGIITLIGFSTLFFSTKRWFLLNQAQGISIPFKRTILPAYLGIAFNNLLPGGVGGDFYRCFYLFRKVDDSKTTIMLSILFDRIMGLMGIFVIAGLFSVLQTGTETISRYFIFTSVGICFSVVALFFLSMILPQKLGLSKWIEKNYAQHPIGKRLLTLLNGLQQYRYAKITLIKCLLISVIIQLIIAFTCLLIAKLLHFPPISFFSIVLAVGITQIVNLIPITPGGFGVGEAAFAKVLMLLNPGYAASYATIFLAYRIVNILPYTPSILIPAINNPFSRASVIMKNKVQ